MTHRLWSLIRTEFLRRFDHPSSLIFFLLLPVLFTAAVSVGLSGMMGNDDAVTEELRMRLYVQQDAAAVDERLVEALLNSLRNANLDLEFVDTLPENSFGLEIPADFAENLQNGEEITLTLHTRNSSQSNAVEQAVRAAQSRVGAAVQVAQTGLEQARSSGLLETEQAERAYFQDLLLQTLAASEDPPVVAQVRWPENSNVTESSYEMTTSVEHASAGQVITWVQITLLGTAEVLTGERLRGTLKRLLITPTSRAVILGGKLLANLLVGLLQIAILLISGTLLFGVQWDRAPLAVTCVSIAFALAMTSLGTLLATFVKTRNQASSVVVGLSMTMAALGGAWFPLEITPAIFRQVVQILPSTWAMKAYSDILARGAQLADVSLAVGVLLAFAVLFTALSMVRFKRYT